MHVEPRHLRSLWARGGTKAVLVERHGHAAFREAEIGAVDQRQLHARFERGELGRLVRSVFGGALVDKAAAAQPSKLRIDRQLTILVDEACVILAKRNPLEKLP